MLTDRITRMTPSATIELEGIVADLHAAGVPVIALNAGEPDFETPSNIADACDRAVRAGKTRYVNINGIPELRNAICDKFKRDSNVTYAPNEIVVSTGAKQALFNTVETLVQQGDEVIIPVPCWVSYIEMVKLAEGTPVLVDTFENFHLDIEAIKKKISPKTKAIMINSPCNPTGVVYYREELQQLVDLAIKHDFFIISDEIYEKLVYDGRDNICVASFSEEAKQHTVIINGFSKSYAMTGWRIGYCAAPAKIARGICSLQGHTTSNSTTFVQWAALEALTGPQDSVYRMKEEFDRRRTYLLERIKAIPGIKCQNAEGAFYLLPDVSSYFGKKTPEGKVIANSIDISSYLLSEAKLAILPGAAFEAPKCIRIAYSNSVDNIRKGMDAMAEALAKLK